MNKKNNILNSLIATIAVICIWTISCVDLQAQGWERRLGSIGNDYGHDAVQIEDDGYLIIGHESTSNNGADISLVRIDVDGNTIWSNLYGGNGNDFGRSVIKTQDGGFLIAGYSDSFGNVFKKEAYLIKVDNEGNIEWDEHYGGNSPDDALAVIELANGDYVFVGSTFSFGNGSSDVYLSKVNSLGEIIWSNSLGDEHLNYGLDLIQTNDGGFAITGRTDVDGQDKNIYLLKTDENGEFEWSNNFGDDNFDIGNALIQTEDQGFMIAVSANIGNTAQVIKTDNNGNEIWTKDFTFAGEASSRDIVRTSDGNYAIFGFIEVNIDNYH